MAVKPRHNQPQRRAKVDPALPLPPVLLKAARPKEREPRERRVAMKETRAVQG